VLFAEGEGVRGKDARSQSVRRNVNTQRVLHESDERMIINRDSDLARIREVRMRISAEFHDDPELLVRHYVELQERHRDRLVRSTEGGTEDSPKGQAAREHSEN
jgi:hypothetical protein